MKYPTLIALLFALIGSGILLPMLTPDTNVNFEEFALGEATSAYFAHTNGYPIHLDNLNTAVVDSLLDGWQTRGKKDVIFLFGNSQMHGINQFARGQVSYNHILFDSLHTQYDVLAQSVPNANLQEFLYMFQFWNARVKITRLIVPVFFDDMREDGIRFAYDMARNETMYLDESTQQAKEWNNAIRSAEDAAAIHTDNAALANTTQERVELFLDSTIAHHSVTWRSRPEMRGHLFTQLFFLRNRVFGIDPQTIRRILPVVYEKNLNALKLLMSRTQEEGIEMVLYIPPIRSDVQIPYDQAEYAQFKTQISELAADYPHITLSNLESIVEGKYWGMKENTALGGDELEYDFMHFSYVGHQVLAASLYTLIRSSLQ